jgi:hypothetical protein
MGTNYYHHIDVCECCGRAGEVVHVGKSSAGWTFTFQGTEEIRSYQDWLDAMEADPASKILDEYGREISLEDFKAIVELKRDENRNHARDYPDGSWLDPDGHSFSGHDFS